MATQIRSNSNRAAGLTRQLLAYSRRQIMRLTPIELNAAIDHMTGLFRRLINADIEMEFHFEPDLPPILADLSQVEQIIMNLAINARDALPGGGKIRFTTARLKVREEDRPRYPEVEPGNYVAMAVTDDGIGMDADVRARIFEPFFTTKEVGKGTGLGLSMVYGFAQQSGGTVRVRSKPGEGTTFVVDLPVTVAAPDALAR